VFFERVGLARDRQEVEDAAAVVVEQHDGERQLQAPGGHKAADVVGERYVADQQHDRSVAGGGGAEGGGDRAVDPVGAAVGQDASQAGSLAVTSPAVRPSSSARAEACTRSPTTAAGSCQTPSGSIAT